MNGAEIEKNSCVLRQRGARIRWPFLGVPAVNIVALIIFLYEPP